MKQLPINTVDTSFEIRTSEEEVAHLLRSVEEAKKSALPGQTVRIKISDNTCLVFDIKKKAVQPPPVIGSQYNKEADI